GQARSTLAPSPPTPASASSSPPAATPASSSSSSFQSPSGWHLHTIDAFAAPNFRDEQAARDGVERQLTLADLLALPADRLDYAPRPYLITRHWVKERYSEWVPGPLWGSKVPGKLPR